MATSNRQLTSDNGQFRRPAPALSIHQSAFNIFPVPHSALCTMHSALLLPSPFCNLKFSFFNLQSPSLPTNVPLPTSAPPCGTLWDIASTTLLSTTYNRFFAKKSPKCPTSHFHSLPTAQKAPQSEISLASSPPADKISRPCTHRFDLPSSYDRPASHLGFIPNRDRPTPRFIPHQLPRFPLNPAARAAKFAELLSL